MTVSVHQIILDKIGPDVIQAVSDGGEWSDPILLRLIFDNYRKYRGEHRGLKLSRLGHQCLSNYYDAFQYEVSKSYNRKTVYVALDRFQIRPYYLDGQTVTFYDDLDASTFVMLGYDLEKYASYIAQ